MSSGVALPTAVPALPGGTLLTTQNLYPQSIQPGCPVFSQVQREDGSATCLPAPADPALAATPLPTARSVIPSAFGPDASVPVVPVDLAAQVEVRDGVRALEVSAHFADAVLVVRHFDDPKGGRVTGVTRGIIGASALAIAGVLLMLLFNFVQVGREKAAQAEAELAPQGQHDPPRRAPENPAKDIVAIILLGSGLLGMVHGLGRRSRELKENAFTIGSDPGVTFPTPAAALPVGTLPLVASSGTDYEVTFTAPMSGELQLDGQRIPLSELARSGQARPSGAVAGAYVMTVPPAARIHLRLWDNSFSISSVARPRAYAVPIGIDWRILSYPGAVFAAVGLVAVLMLRLPPQPRSLSVDALLRDPRWAKLVLKPEEVPDWLKMTDLEAPSSGGRHGRVPEGKLGKQDTHAKGGLFAIKGPPTAPRLARDEARKVGVLGVLDSQRAASQVASFARSSALGRDAADAMGSLVGSEVGDAYGPSGLGVVGSGRGGGGVGMRGRIGQGGGTGAAPGIGLIGSRPSDREPNTEAYARVDENPFRSVQVAPLSTFSVDVDTASYSNLRRFLLQGQLPPVDAVRIEELINYFPYDYKPPTSSEPFASNLEIAGCPWAPQHRLLRIGIKGRELAPQSRPASNLTFLIDVSGSMESENKLPLIKRSLALLSRTLDARDRVAIVVYAGSSGVALPPTRGDQTAVILGALARLQADGSTNGAGGIKLAYELAAKNFIRGGANRVILATDGDFNVGATSEGELTRLIENKARQGVFLSVLGFGMGNYKDSMMEKLADRGNGNYAYIDTLKEAHKVLVQELTGTLVTIAKDVKLQIEFNPAKVKAYRQIGYENRQLRDEDFNSDQVDAGEIGAGHTVTALYEVVPVDVAIALPSVDPLKYRAALPPAAPQSGELATVKIRYKSPTAEKSQLSSFPITDRLLSWKEASADFQFASAVAEFGMLLRGSKQRGSSSWTSVLELARRGRGADPHGYRAEMVQLVELAARMQESR